MPTEEAGSMETEIFAWIFALIAYAMIGIAIVEVYKAVFDNGIESREIGRASCRERV